MVFVVNGNWRLGKAFDLHTVASTHLGIDEYGHDRFENVRSEMGELVYQLKYKQDKSVLNKIVNLLDGISGIEKFDYLIPIPATNKTRKIQPVEAIAVALGQHRSVAVLTDALLNDGKEELKSVSDPVMRNELLKESITIYKPERLVGKKVLLIDDLYRSGSTLTVATELLLKMGKAEQVCVLTMTKTRNNR